MKRQKAEREQAFLREPEALDSLCAFITDRGTLAEWCKVNDLRYSPTYAWLHDTANPDRLDRYTKALEARQHALTDVVVSGLRDGAQADIRRLYNNKGELLQPHEVPDDMARVVAGFEEDKDGCRKVKIEGRGKSFELLGRALGLYRDRVEHEGKLTLEEIVGGSYGDGSHQGHTGSMTPGASDRDPPPGRRSPSKT